MVHGGCDRSDHHGLMTDCDHVTDSELATWHHMSMRGMGGAKLAAMIYWLRKQDGGRFYWNVNAGFWFERSDDLIHCVLSWK